MSLLVCFVLTALVINACEAKPVQFKGYPEENRNVNDRNLFEGDMLVNPEVKKIALAGGDIFMTTEGRKRGAVKNHTQYSRLWPAGRIPYVIDSLVPNDDHQVDAIMKAMGEWENGTCLSFVPYDDSSGEVYIKIRSDYAGCFAFVGYKYLPPSLPTAWRGLTLNLDPTCFDPSHRHRVLLHELGHVIGFYHEQSRPDRDLYVNILYDNILDDKYNEFRKYQNTQIDSLNSPYDFRSVMHYGPKTYSKNDLNTIEPVDPNAVYQTNCRWCYIKKLPRCTLVPLDSSNIMYQKFTFISGTLTVKKVPYIWL